MEQVVSIEVKPVNKKKVRKLWKIAMILGVVTAIEFVMAFTLPRGYLLYAGFIALTLLKAFYIVSHLQQFTFFSRFLGIMSSICPIILRKVNLNHLHLIQFLILRLSALKNCGILMALRLMRIVLQEILLCLSLHPPNLIIKKEIIRSNAYPIFFGMKVQSG